jgi:ATP-dependent helicase Lhr and Lhr-like helicase
MSSGVAALHPVVQHHIVNTLGWGSLRSTQEAAIEPILRGDDVLLLAPTAGGKTEAAFFPLLSRMADEDWRGMSVLYVCPLRALLNNLAPRLESYCGWFGRRLGVRHGDTTTGARRRLAVDRPDVLLTTPESLEAMLVSTLLTPREVFADLRAVVIDEVHAFAGDDRGWHLLAVLERVTRLAGRPLQRIGLSATVGNPESLLEWLQGGGGTQRPRTTVVPAALPGPAADVQLDYVGNLANAATVIASLHRGEKRLVFAESRRAVETLAVNLRSLGVETFISHSSLAVEERRRAERAFSESRDCVIVSTSTLELGIDVGDLDRVLQVGAPGTVASFLQRLGRTGRRGDAARNMILLATDDDELLQAAGLLLLWNEGYVEPVTPPPTPRHVAAQQLLALCLQEGQVGQKTWTEWFGGLAVATPDEMVQIASWLVESGHLDQDSGMLFVGPAAERRFGHKHFLELLSVFTAAPQFTVLHGRVEIGSIDPMALARRVEGPRILSLAGRSWLVNHTDWKRRRTFVEPTDLRSDSRWFGIGSPQSYALTDGMRRVLLGATPGGVGLSKRALVRLAAERAAQGQAVHPEATVISARDGRAVRWWTWAGARANTVIGAAIAAVQPGLVQEIDRYGDRSVRLADDATAGIVARAVREANRAFGPGLAELQPSVSDEALKRLRFAELLPPSLAVSTLAARSADHKGTQVVLARPIIDRGGSPG